MSENQADPAPENAEKNAQVPAAEPQVVSEPAKQETQKKPNTKSAAVKGMSGLQKFLLLLCFLIALAAAGVSAWLYRELIMLPGEDDRAQLEQEQQYRELKMRLSGQGSELDELRQSLSGQRELMAQLRQDMQQSLIALNQQQQKTIENLAQLSSVDRNDWVLAEAEFLLRLATQRAQLNRDARAAAKLLISADQILQALDDPALHPVRAALAEEVAALQGVAEFDTEGVFLKLQALIKAAEGLRLYHAPRFQAEVLPMADQEPHWQDQLAAGFQYAWQKLNSYIRVRHHDQNFEPMLAPEQEGALRASVRMMLEQAQLALLSERPQVYRQSLLKAGETIKRHYLLDQQRDALLQELSELAELDVERKLPTVGDSQNALKVYLNSRRWQREAGQ